MIIILKYRKFFTADTQLDSMKLKTIGSLFKPEPQAWGLRGDPILWKDLARVFRAVPLPDSSHVLKSMLKAAFYSLTAHTINSSKSFIVERYARNGMSSGHISPEFWREKGINILLSRYVSIQNSNSSPDSSCE